MTQPKRVLSLGAGIQSSTVLLMSCKGILPKLDAAVFADTQWEPPEVYRVLDFLTDEAGKHGIPVHRVTAGDLRAHTMAGHVRGLKSDGETYTCLPLFVKTNGSEARGMVRRQCTTHYKLDPIRRFVRRNVLGLQPRQRATPLSVDQWMGISADEAGRMRNSRDAWARNVYPLCNHPDDMLPRRMNRRACVAWLEEHYPGVEFARSACVGCPYHSDAEWRAIKADPQQWADAVEVDRAVRDKVNNGAAFLHASLRPLEDVDLSTDFDRGQLPLFGNECEGLCGV